MINKECKYKDNRYPVAYIRKNWFICIYDYSSWHLARLHDTALEEAEVLWIQLDLDRRVYRIGFWYEVRDTIDIYSLIW